MTVAGVESRPDDPTALAAAADRIRETTKWLIASFAGIGAVLVAGSQLAALGTLDRNRFVVAVLSVVLGLCALALAIAKAAGVLTVGRVSLSDLADVSQAELGEVRLRVNGDPALMAGFVSVGQLNTEYSRALAARKQDFDAHYADVHDKDKALAAQLSDAKVVATDQAVQRVLTVASFYVLSDAFDAARGWIICSALAAALAVVGFAWASHPPKQEAGSPIAVATPSVVRLKLSDQGRALLVGPLGAKCAAAHIGAIVLRVTDGTADVVTLPTKRCRVARLSIAADAGTIETSTKPVRVVPHVRPSRGP